MPEVWKGLHGPILGWECRDHNPVLSNRNRMQARGVSHIFNLSFMVATLKKEAKESGPINYINTPYIFL